MYSHECAGMQSSHHMMKNHILPSINQGNTYLALADPSTMGSAFAYGKHHAKYGLLFHERGLRVFITTANYISCDLVDLTNAVYVQDFPLQKKDNTLTVHVNTEFEDELTSFFKHLSANMKLGEETRNGVNKMVSRLKDYDFSSAECDLILAVPGHHKNDHLSRYGQKRVNHILKSNRDSETMSDNFLDAKVISNTSEPLTLACKRHGVALQHSSFASLGQSGEFLNDLCGSNGFSPFNQNPEIQLIWPTYQTIIESVLGISSGGSIPADRKNFYDKSNNFVVNIQRALRRWDGTPTGRKHVVAHMKCYFGYSYFDRDYDNNGNKYVVDLTSPTLSPVSRKRPRGEPSVTKDHTKQSMIKFKLYQQPESDHIDIDWIILTSSNVSKAAWGVLQKQNTQLYMRSYEMGVMFMPNKIKSTKRRFSLTPSHPLFGLGMNDESQHSASTHGGAQDNIVRLDVPFKFPADRYVIEGPNQDIPWMTSTST